MKTVMTKAAAELAQPVLDLSIEEIAHEALRTGHLEQRQQTHLYRLLEKGWFDDADLHMLQELVDALMNRTVISA